MCAVWIFTYCLFTLCLSAPGTRKGEAKGEQGMGAETHLSPYPLVGQFCVHCHAALPEMRGSRRACGWRGCGKSIARDEKREAEAGRPWIAIAVPIRL